MNYQRIQKKPSYIGQKQGVNQNENIEDYLENQNLYNPEFETSQSKQNRQPAFRVNNQQNGKRSISLDNRVNSESGRIDIKQEYSLKQNMQTDNKSSSCLDQHQKSKIRSFLSPNYYKQNFKDSLKQDLQKESGLRDIEKRRLNKDKVLIENYFKIPIVLHSIKKDMSQQDYQGFVNQQNIQVGQGYDTEQTKKQYIQFKQNQEAYHLNNSLNKQLECNNSESKLEKQRFVLRECGSPNKQKQFINSNNNASSFLNSISTESGSKKYQNVVDRSQTDRYTVMQQQKTQNCRNRSLKQHSYHQPSNKEQRQRISSIKNDSNQIENNIISQYQHTSSENCLNDANLLTQMYYTQNKQSFDDNQQIINSQSNQILQMSPTLITSKPKIENPDISLFNINSPQNTSYHGEEQNQSKATIKSLLTPVGKSTNTRKKQTIKSNIFEHSPEKLLYEGTQKIQFIPSNDQPPLILPINQDLPIEIYEQVYVDEIGQPINYERENKRQIHNKQKRSYIGQTKNQFQKGSIIQSLNKDFDLISSGQKNNNSQNMLNKSLVAAEQSFSSVNSLFQMKNKYDILKNFQIISQIGKGTHAEIYKVKNVLTGKLQIAKRIQFLTKYAEKAYENESFVLSQFFTENGSIKKQFQSHSGTYKLVQTTHFEQLENEGIFIQQSGGKSLARSLFEIREETLKGELISHIYPTKLHQSLKNNKEQFYEIIMSVCEVIDLFSKNKIVHSDLRLENILAETLDFGDSCVIQSIKISDFGSSYSLDNRKGVSNVIPEYMPPEIVQQILGQQGQVVFIEEAPWTVDIWTLGCVPIWMPQRCLFHSHGCDSKKVTSGIFSHKERRLDKILEKQVKFAKQISQFFIDYKENITPYLFKIDPKIERILIGIFKMDPRERLSPLQIINIIKNN